MLLTILTFIILLSILVLIHELGHFLAAKRAGVRVEEFGLGYPPQLWSKRIGETIYSINLLPIGGFVRLTGEEGDLPGMIQEEKSVSVESAGIEGSAVEVSVEQEHFEVQVDDARIVAEVKEVAISNYPEGSMRDSRSFADQTNFVKTSILISGVLMNFLLGVLLVAITFAFLGMPEIKNLIELQEVIPGTPAAEAGLQSGELISGFRVQGSGFRAVGSSEEFVEFVNQCLGEEIVFEARSQEEEVREVSVIPRVEPPEGEGPLGIIFVVVPEISYHKIPVLQVPGRAVIEGFKLAGLVLGGVVRIFRDLVFAGKVPKDIAGPVGIARLTGEVAKQGFFQVVNFAALLSINLGVVNILPFPGLDGGRLSFVLAEVVLRRKIKAKYQKWVHTIGIDALLLLMLLITFYDILRFL